MTILDNSISLKGKQNIFCSVETVPVKKRMSWTREKNLKIEEDA